jgi:hypothetical protein
MVDLKEEKMEITMADLLGWYLVPKMVEMRGSRTAATSVADWVLPKGLLLAEKMADKSAGMTEIGLDEMTAGTTVAQLVGSWVVQLEKPLADKLVRKRGQH